MKILHAVLSIGLAGSLASCAPKAPPPPPKPRDTVVQSGSMEALKQGSCEARTTVGETRKRGDFAIGISRGLGADFLMLSNVAYRTSTTGSLIPAADTDALAFVTTAFFEPDLMFDIGSTPRKVYENAMDMKRPSPGRIYAYRVAGAFSKVEVRELPPPLQPCEKLTRALNHVGKTVRTNLHGTLFGFWSPKSLRLIAGEGYDYAFISDDGTFGGIVTDFVIAQARIEIDDSDEVLLELD